MNEDQQLNFYELCKKNGLSPEQATKVTSALKDWTFESAEMKLEMWLPEIKNVPAEVL